MRVSISRRLETQRCGAREARYCKKECHFWRVCAPTHRGEGGPPPPLVWVVAENGRPRKWYAGRVTRRDPAEPRPDSNRPERERKNGKKEESRERERRPPGEARNERRRREVHAQLIWIIRNRRRNRTRGIVVARLDEATTATPNLPSVQASAYLIIIVRALISRLIIIPEYWRGVSKTRNSPLLRDIQSTSRGREFDRE